MIIRRCIISLLALLLWQGAVMAVPAWPSVTQARQPDGTTLNIRLHGDEYLHYCTTADGYTIIRNAQGYYVYAEELANHRGRLCSWGWRCLGGCCAEGRGPIASLHPGRCSDGDYGYYCQTSIQIVCCRN